MEKVPYRRIDICWTPFFALDACSSVGAHNDHDIPFYDNGARLEHPRGVCRAVFLWPLAVFWVGGLHLNTHVYTLGTESLDRDVFFLLHWNHDGAICRVS